MAWTAVNRTNARGVLGLIGAMAVVFGSGCATPARPELSHLTDQAVPEPYNGEYVATFHTRWFGPVYARLTAQRTGDGFKANTAPGVAWSLVGGVEQVLGQVFAPFLFPSGMLLVWTSEDPEAKAGAPAEGWIGPATIDPWRLPTTMSRPEGPVVIRYRDGRALGVMTLARPAAQPLPRTDYSLLNQRLGDIMRASYYDPDALDAAAMKSFLTDIKAAEPAVRDDLTYLASLALAWRKHSGVAMPLPSRRQEALSRELLSAVQNPVESLSAKVSEKSRIATIDAVVFEDAQAIDRMMEHLISQDPAGILLDLRNCTGLDLSALRLVSWLVREPVDAGMFVAGSKRALVKSGDADRIEAEAVAIDGPARVASATSTLEREGSVLLSVHPADRVYAGPLVVLTSSRTRSTGELLAWLLQSTGRARVVGEKTAQRPRLSREHDLGQGFVVRIDEFDWVPPLEASGGKTDPAVVPDVAASRQRAPARGSRLLADLIAEGDAGQARPGTKK